MLAKADLLINSICSMGKQAQAPVVQMKTANGLSWDFFGAVVFVV